MNRNKINLVLEELYEKRQNSRIEAEKRRKMLYEQLPLLKAIDDDIASCGLKLMKASIEESEKYDEALVRIKKETEKLCEERKKLLLQHGYSENICDPVYSCKKCNDTGYVKGGFCECLKKAVALRSYRESGLGKALEAQSFDNFNISYYLKGNDTEKFNYMVNLFADAKRFANEFDGDGNLLMIGGTGLGKTHLSSAIAKVVIEKGYTVVYESAQNIFDTYENKKFGRTPDADTDRFINSDLLIIDDLGTENISQFTVSVLYNLINERTNNCKSLIINTNLSPDELKNIYKPRIFSRLFGDFQLMRFCGVDIRMQKLGE